jgi:hypothetical protein
MAISGIQKISDLQKISDIRRQVDRLNSDAPSAEQLMDSITLLLNNQMLKYNWVGF